MKKFLAMSLSLFFVLAIAGAALSQEMEMKGTVKSVAGDGKSIVVTTRDGDKTVAIGSKTKGADAAKADAKVTVKYTEKDGTIRASEITVR